MVLSTPHPYTFFRELAKPDSEQRKRSHYIDLVRENTTASMLEYFVGLTKDTSLFGEFWRWPRVRAPRLSRRRAMVEVNLSSPLQSVVTGRNRGEQA